MTGPASTARIFLKRGATDMRKGFDGLSGLVRECKRPANRTPRRQASGFGSDVDQVACGFQTSGSS